MEAVWPGMAEWRNGGCNCPPRPKLHIGKLFLFLLLPFSLKRPRNKSIKLQQFETTFQRIFPKHVQTLETFWHFVSNYAKTLILESCAICAVLTRTVRAECTSFSLLPGLAALLRSACFFAGASFFARMTLSRSAFHGFQIGFKQCKGV